MKKNGNGFTNYCGEIAFLATMILIAQGNDGECVFSQASNCYNFEKWAYVFINIVSLLI